MDGGDCLAPRVHLEPSLWRWQRLVDIEAAGALEIHTSGNADWVTVAGDSVWLADIGTGITRYDMATGEKLGEIAAKDICLAMDEGFGSLWAGDCVDNTLLRLDLATGELLATIDLPFRLPPESSVAVGGDGVWMLSTGTQPELVRLPRRRRDRRRHRWG